MRAWMERLFLVETTTTTTTKTINSSKTRVNNKNEISRLEEGSWGNFFLFSWWSREQRHWECVCWFMLGKFFCGSPERSLVWDGNPDTDELRFIKECKIALISTTVSLGWTVSVHIWLCLHHSQIWGLPSRVQPGKCSRHLFSSPTLLRMQLGSRGRVCWPHTGMPTLSPGDGMRLHAWPQPSFTPVKVHGTHLIARQFRTFQSKKWPFSSLCQWFNELILWSWV